MKECKPLIYGKNINVYFLSKETSWVLWVNEKYLPTMFVFNAVIKPNISFAGWCCREKVMSSVIDIHTVKVMINQLPSMNIVYIYTHTEVYNHHIQI